MNSHPFSALFDHPESWQVFASGHAKGKISPTVGPGGEAGLRLDYDFNGGGGFVVIRQVIRFTLPGTFEIGFRMRGEGPPNHFEFKVADPGGRNVWRNLRQNFPPPAAWCDYQFNERSLPFAWGPAGGGAASVIESVEFVIAAGPGGHGMLELSCPSFEDQRLLCPRCIHASSELPGYPASAIFGEGLLTAWKAAPGDRQPWWRMDFGRSLRFGGVVIQWAEPLPPRAFAVQISDDGTTWSTLYAAEASVGVRSHIPTPGAEAKHLRLFFEQPAGAALLSLSLRPDAYSRTPNEFIHQVAAEFPRGWLPRYWLREQSYWTPVGSPDGKRRALINEEGMVEVDEAGFSLEPFIVSTGQRITWAHVQTINRLADGGLPVPSVTWKSDDLELDIMPWVDGNLEALTLHVTYRLKYRNPGTEARLVVAVRPFQVNPPWQAFRDLGGISPIHHISCGADLIHAEGRRMKIEPPADHHGTAAFEEGGILWILASGLMPTRTSVEDKTGYASAIVAWNLPPDGNAFEATISMPYFEKGGSSGREARTEALVGWHRTLHLVQWQVPPCAAAAFDCFRTAAGHILINRDGPAIQPGPRRYTRSWVRDCVIMGAALAKAGLPHVLREFLTWYAPFQREDGFIPCVVDRDGIDWLVEHDSHGQFLWGVREVMRQGGDEDFLRSMLPFVTKAADYLVTLRRERMTPEYAQGEFSACYGLLPESASHEGYLAHPVHAYWDDFWGVRGLEAAADLAAVAGLAQDSSRWRTEAHVFLGDLLKSIGLVIARKELGYIPGSVEWADFDPTATSNAIAQLDFADVLPAGPLHAMLDTYLEGFRRKHRGETPWNNYSAYEIRIIGAFVRLGKRHEANELLQFFLSDRRPQEWNQWPEITWRNPLSPGHLGDVPHTWIAAEYLLALASMVASEREATNSMVLASGMPWAWISTGDGFAVKGLPTRYGTLDFRIKAHPDNAIEIVVGGSLTLPPGGLTIAPPPPDSQPVPAGPIVITVNSLPFETVFQPDSMPLT